MLHNDPHIWVSKVKQDILQHTSRLGSKHPYGPNVLKGTYKALRGHLFEVTNCSVKVHVAYKEWTKNCLFRSL